MAGKQDIHQGCINLSLQRCQVLRRWQVGLPTLPGLVTLAGWGVLSSLPRLAGLVTLPGWRVFSLCQRCQVW